MINAEIRYYMQIRRDEIDRQLRKKVRNDQTLDKRRVVNFEHSGYAFSGAEGMDKLVTDNLTNRLKDAIHRQVFGKMFETGDTEDKLLVSQSLPAEMPIGFSINDD